MFIDMLLFLLSIPLIKFKLSFDMLFDVHRCSYSLLCVIDFYVVSYVCFIYFYLFSYLLWIINYCHKVKRCSEPCHKCLMILICVH